MVENKLPVINDYIFKKIFSKKGNESILKDFLIGVLNIPIEKVEAKAEVSLEKQLAENKLGRLDILAILDNNTIVNIEVQILNKYNFIDRTIYYWSGIYYNELNSGEDYNRSKRTIVINILDYELFDKGPYHEIVKLKRDFENKILTDKMEFHFIQIPKFLKVNTETKTKLEQWMQFISQKDEEGVKSAMKENEEIKKAKEEYEYLIGDEEERRLAFLREKAIRDERNNLQGSREEGIEIGRKEGEAKGKKEKQIEIAKNMVKEGIDIKIISRVTNLSIKEIEKL